MKNLTAIALSITSITIGAQSSIATGTLPQSPRPSDPVTTIAVVYCPNGSTQGPRHQICLDSIAYKPASQNEPVKTKGPKIVTRFELAEGVDRDPRGPSTPKCSENGPNQRDCSMWRLVGSVALIADGSGDRHVPGGRRGAPKGTSGGGSRLLAGLSKDSSLGKNPKIGAVLIGIRSIG